MLKTITLYLVSWLIMLVIVIPALPMLLVLHFSRADIEEVWEFLSFKILRDVLNNEKKG